MSCKGRSPLWVCLVFGPRSYMEGWMVPVNVILGVAGTAGFTFGLVRTRLAANRGVGTPAGPEDVDPLLDGHPTSTRVDPVEDS
ncbi:MAG: hypothetical protein QOF20_2657 [Acidimicrobiaceae bacterium]|nr:hypothetical protein [Acidimicrobiaceae bacterium]MDQ1365404.1 hypothetical protein [Acidimicrobiaceae bacterium]MDQ1370304.1 hypothetical protein [Acidimicrobiaceae bacterium]MDQ1377186.1 hypothetical protein [Acidimicrobiaceae bacterium]MDQ1399864.1 hypothetical protein [Acidimicrobiaceae bacterium]